MKSTKRAGRKPRNATIAPDAASATPDANNSVNLGGKRKLVYPLGATATLGDASRIALGASSTLVTLTGTTPDGRKLTVRDSAGTVHTVLFANIGVLTVTDDAGKIVPSTVKAWQRA